MPQDLKIPQIKLEDDTSSLEVKRSSTLEPEGLSQIKPQTVEGDKNTPSSEGGFQKQEETKMRFKERFANINFPSGRKIKIILGSILVVFLIVFVLVLFPAISLYRNAKVLAADINKIQESVSSQDIAKIKEALSILEKDLVSTKGSVKGFSWVKAIPFLGNYVRDADAGISAGIYGIDAAKVLIETAEPYADIIGFTGSSANQSVSGEDSANDRMEFIIQTIGDIIPKLDTISEKATLAKNEIDKIDPNRYPEKIRGIEVRAKMKKGIELADEGTRFLSESKPLLEAAPYLLGIDEERTYLLLFQNDKELRPTGGFLTAYSIMTVNKGKIQPVSSSDMYSLDAKYTPSITAPDPIINYIKGPYTVSKLLRLRDMNWKPDFYESMKDFSAEIEKVGIKDIDGIIAVDTHVVVNILSALGTIGVPGFGNFNTENDPRCSCPQVIYELESFADVEGPVVWSENEPGKIVFAPKNYGKNRKEIVGPLMNSVLSNALGQPKDKLPLLFEAGWKSVTEKHVLLYMFDSKVQSAVESFNIAGRLKDTKDDYLHINDSNLGGRKSNLYVTQEVHQTYESQKDGSIIKTLEITYKNNKEHDGWLNSVLPNWTRVYVPKGSEIISVDGFEDKADPYEEGEKTVFSGGFQLRPQGVVKVSIKYKLPMKLKGDFKLLIQKQPGADKPLYTITAGKILEELFLSTDKEFKLKI